jgi:hydrogenase maturation protease
MDLFDISRLSGTFPEQRALIGIEPASLGWGDAPSPEVAPAMPRVAEMALALASRWRQ